MTRSWVCLLYATLLVSYSLGFSTNQPLRIGIQAHAGHEGPLTMTSNSRLFMTTSIHSASENESSLFMSTTQETDENKAAKKPLRTRLRQATGFSLTAFRATMRAATGISLTALYASTLAATNAFVRKTMALILSPLPPWFRYFLQPFLILYYAPLFILRNLTGPTRRKAKETHEVFVDGFKAAVDAAEKKADGYWPVHVTEEGEIVSVESTKQSAKSVDVNEGIAESVEAVMEDRDESS